jgi:hypothetical protein
VAVHEIIAVLLVAVPASLMLALVVIERPRQLEQELQSVPRRLTGELQEGMYRVTGRARRGAPLLVAPVSGRSCLAWRLVVERPALSRDTAAARLRRRRVAIDLRACGEFWIEDEAGRAAVQPGSHFALAVQAGARAVRGRWSQLTPEVRAELQRQRAVDGAITAAWDPHPGATARFTELAIEEDQILSVGGEVHRELHPLGEGGGRAAPMRWTFRGTRPNPLILSDEPA